MAAQKSEERSPYAPSFRVMRLGSQIPSRRPPVPLIWSRLGRGADDLPGWEGEGAICGVGMVSTLPSTFGNVFVGETLRALVNLHNGAENDVLLTRLQVELEIAPGNVIHLLETGPDAEDMTILKTQTGLENLVEAVVTASGPHSIICSAVYTDHKGERKSAKQVFRFNVMPPLKVSVKPISLRNSDFFASNQFLIDFHLTNLMSAPIHIQTAKLVPFEGYAVTDLNITAEKKDTPSSEDDQDEDYTDAATNNGDTVSFMFLVEHRPSVTPARENGKYRVGSLEVSWQAAGGESGRIDDIVAEVDIPRPRAEVEVLVTAVPQRIEAQKPFVARCSIQNNSDRSIRLYLQVRRDMVGEVVPTGTSGRNLGAVAAGSSAAVLLPLLALSPGTHRISGVRVVDIDSRQGYAAEAPEIVAL